MMRVLLRLVLAGTVAWIALAARATTSSPLSAIGRGAAIVFSPDLSIERNCAFYERLGFACFATASWEEVVEAIRCRNENARPEDAISVVILEAHGTQGNGLKLQASSARNARRSYAAVGAVRERLAAAGVRYCVLAACNSRRLLRPAIYHRLDRERLFLPPTLGIMNAGSREAGDGVRLFVRADSHIESLSVGKTAELSPSTLRALGLTESEPITFVVSDIFVQLLTRDPSLDLREATPVNRLALVTPEDAYADDLFARFVGHLDELAASEQPAPNASLVALLDEKRR
jgi:hypothetical protein